MMELDFIISMYYVYRKGGYKINIKEHKFSKLEIDIINNELNIYLSKDDFDRFMYILKRKGDGC